MKHYGLEIPAGSTIENLTAAGGTFTAGESVTFNDNSFILSTTAPQIRWDETGAPAGEEAWRLVADGGVWRLDTIDDATTPSSFATAFQVNRTGLTVNSFDVKAGSLTHNGIAVPTVGADNTFTGSNTFSATLKLTNTANGINCESATPRVRFQQTDASLDQGVWRLIATSETFSLSLNDDANTVNKTILQFHRSGTGGSMIGDSANFTVTNLLHNSKPVPSYTTLGTTAPSEAVTTNANGAIIHTAAMRIKAESPQYIWEDTNADTDEKVTRLGKVTSGSPFTMTFEDDAFLNPVEVFTISRSGTTPVTFDIKSTNLQHNGVSVLKNVVEDITPQLGGDLAVNGNSIVGLSATTPFEDTNGNELISFVVGAAAVTGFTIENSSNQGNGFGPILSVESGSTNTGMRIQAKGTGYINIGASAGGYIICKDEIDFSQNAQFKEVAPQDIAYNGYIRVYADSSDARLYSRSDAASGGIVHVLDVDSLADCTDVNLGSPLAADEILTFDGSNWINQGPQLYHAFDSAGGIQMSSTNGVWTDITWDTNPKKDSGYTFTTTNADITINTNGWYQVTVDMSFHDDATSTISSRINTETRLVINDGVGSPAFTEIPGSLATSYSRDASTDRSSCSITKLIEFTAGDILKVQSTVELSILANQTVATMPDGSRVTIIKQG